MQERKKRRIVIASVLKPVDDTRMYEKLGLTLSKIADVHIAGFPSTAQTLGITAHPSRSFRRISWQRFIQPWRFLRLLQAVAPHAVIVTTHELLLPAIIFRLIAKAAVYYDVQENYARNILYTNAFPLLIRPLLSAYVRLKELVLAPAIHRFILAERCYFDEMPFVRSRATILENKVKRTATEHVNSSTRRDGSRKLIFTGTLAESTGVFEAIMLASELHHVDPRIELTIAGFCARKNDYLRLTNAIKDKPFITLLGGDALVPHHVVLGLIAQAHFALATYQISPALKNRIPTKFFEYLAFGLPVITPNHPPWTSFLAKYKAAIFYDPRAADVQSILLQMETSERPVPTPTNGLFWEENEGLLLELFGDSKNRSI